MSRPPCRADATLCSVCGGRMEALCDCRKLGICLACGAGWGGPAAALGHGPDDIADPDLDRAFDPREGELS